MSGKDGLCSLTTIISAISPNTNNIAEIASDSIEIGEKTQGYYRFIS